MKKQVVSKCHKIYFNRNNITIPSLVLGWENGVHQSRISPWGNSTPFSSRGDVGAPHMATLSLPGLAIFLPVWLFSTSVIQNTMILEQSNQQPDDTRVTPHPSTSFVSPSPSSSSLGEIMFQKKWSYKSCCNKYLSSLCLQA